MTDDFPSTLSLVDFRRLTGADPSDPAAVARQLAFFQHPGMTPSEAAGAEAARRYLSGLLTVQGYATLEDYYKDAGSPNYAFGPGGSTEAQARGAALAQAAGYTPAVVSAPNERTASGPLGGSGLGLLLLAGAAAAALGRRRR